MSWKFWGKKSRKYDGASKNIRLGTWFTGSGDANSEIKHSLTSLRNRARDLRRNNPYASKAISTITNNVVGKGVFTQFENDATSAEWKKWAHSTAIDYDGRNNIFGLQRMVMDAVSESGEVLIRRRVVSGSDFPYQYQILESDFLVSDDTVNPTSKENFVLQGVEFDSNGKRVGYHIYNQHPGSIERIEKSFESSFIPASDIQHVFRADRPGQVRGVPWLAPVMIKLKDLADFEDAELMKQKIAACFTAFVHDISADAECEDEEETITEKLEPATIQKLGPGKSVTFATPPTVDNYQEFVSTQIKSIAAGLNLTYETLGSDLSQTNFSSGRMGWIEMNRSVDAWRAGIIITHMMDPIVKDFFNMLGIIGKQSMDQKYSHIEPKREMIDPTKEIPAYVDAIRAGISSRKEVIGSLGKDYQSVNEQIASDNQVIDKNNFVLDSDPRATTQNGKRQDTENSNEENNDEQS